MLSVTMVEYEFRELRFPRDASRAEVRAALTEAAEYGHWELVRVTLFWGGVRRATLRRKIIRVRRTA
ncbi:DUF5703 family protein [Ornithinimicrobium humiphilum]|uniref:DUF4177 domain-containing protein n=1 Tax=Ornithinimicrobium humiphilum TaxID=125288 RepID=A0A543KPA0_9MICO|nr:DUF5703 family protein [Ornithinimicrobium humiphilum]TQM96896.1 hypothetical protein FB476_1789 [Ornithinimicrobium humiphilum]